MSKRVSRWLACVALAALAAACTSGGPEERPPLAVAPETTAAAPPAPECQLPPLRRQLAQLVMVGFDGTRPTPASLSLAKRGVGGVILFGRNVVSATQVRSLVRGLQAAAPIPLAVAVDQEPGTRVARLAGMVPAVPSARRLGREPPEVVYRDALRLARAMAKLGVTVDYAPVLDVTGVADGVIGDRSFGADPATVTRAGVAFMRGLRDGGVTPVGKHFPGHGASTTDSHEALPVVTLPLAKLSERHVAPFKAAIEAGLPGVMVGHLMTTSLDRNRPASLSPAVVGGLLRRDLGFEGVVVTDALEMGALARWGSIPARAELAIEAGVDQVLVGVPDPPVEAILDRLEQAVGEGRLRRERVREAFVRVERLKGQTGYDACQ